MYNTFIFKVSYYDIDLDDIIFNRSGNWQILSVWRNHINLYLSSKGDVVSISKIRIDKNNFVPLQFIIDKNKYRDYNFCNYIDEKTKVVVVNDEKKSSPSGIVFKNTDYIIYFDISQSKKINFRKSISKLNFVNFVTNLSLVKQHTFIFKPVNITSTVMNKILCFNQIIFNSSFFQLKNFISSNIGLGNGSTPEIDDYFCGLLTFLFVISKFSYNKTKSQIKEIYLSYRTCLEKYRYKTTLLSSTFISQFCKEKLPLKVYHLINLLSCNNKVEIKKNLNSILSSGGNSGWWFLYGFISGEKFLYEQYKKYNKT